MALDKTTLDAYIQALYDDDGQLSSADYQLIINFILSNGEPSTDPRALIQIRRGDEADLPTLAQGELGFTLDTNKLFIGGLSGNVEFKTSEVVTVKSFGALGNGVSDDTLAIQNAIDYAVANSKQLLIPSGTYLITDTLNISGRINIIGEGFYNSTILANSPIESIFTVADNLIGITISFIQLTGNSNANYCIKAPKLSHSLIFRVRMTTSLVAGLLIGYGWDNDVLECMIQNNSGDGIKITDSANNAINIINTKVFLNDGIGIVVRSGRAINIQGCTIETNKITGVYCEFGVEGLSIVDNYFESNGSIGNVFTLPSKTVKTDIIINGSTKQDEMRYAFPSDFIIQNNTHQLNVDSDCAYFLIGANSGVIKRNNYSLAQEIPMIGITLADGYTRVENLNIENNKWNGENFIVDGFGERNLVPAYSWSIDKEDKSNYINQNMLEWSIQLSVTASNIGKANVKFRGKDVFRIELLGNGTSDYWGQTLNMDDYPELHGKPFFATAWVKQNYAGTGGASIYLTSSAFSTTGNSSNVEWKQIVHLGLFPSTGNFKIGYAITNGLTGDQLYITKPFVGMLGVNVDDIETTFEYRDNVAPTSGTWEVGDVVYNNNPIAGGNIGWVCTVAGTPGTWKSFGTIEA